MTTENVIVQLRKAVSEMRRERDDLDQQIGVLEATLKRLEKGAPAAAKGGRRTAAPVAAARKGAESGATPAGRKKPYWSAAARKAAAERMRQYWAKRNKG
jgi:hypothetical protein